ncbi:MAG: Fic family protein [Bacteroidota bacterium]
MKRTGGIVNAAAGTFDTSKGELRLVSVTAGDTFFVNYQKVPQMLDDLCRKIETKIKTVSTNKEVLQLSFDAHYYLVSIHPFGDGNGRTARLLMNFIQSCHNKPLSIVYSEDKKEYIEALTKSREEENPDFFRNFMCNQYVKYLSEQLEKFKKQNKNISFLF